MATMSIKQLKERAVALWSKTTKAFCCTRPRIDTDYDISRDEIIGTCRSCRKQVFRLRSEEIVAQTPESARSDKERSRARRGDPVVRAAQKRLGVPADGIVGPQTLKKIQAEVAERDRIIRERAENPKLQKRSKQLAEMVSTGVLTMDQARALYEDEAKNVMGPPREEPKKAKKPDAATTAIDTNRFANLEDD
jgi:hypothetical protein